MSDRQSYQDRIAEVKEKQSNMDYDQIKQYMSRKSEFMLELDNMKPVKHLWIDRGAKQTCENAGHAYHEAWKIRK